MIVTVTANPAIDITYSLDRIALGQSHRIPVGLARAGGKGVNVARVLHQMRHDTLVVAPTGGATGDAFEADLDASGLRHDLVRVAAPTRQTLAFVTPTETTNLNEEGAALADEDWARLRRTTERALTGASVLVCSGSLPPDTPESVFADLVLAARRAGARTIVDAQGPWLLAAVDAGVDVIKPNEHELSATLGLDPVEAATQLARRCGLVMASFGAEGLLAVRAGEPTVRGRLGEYLAGNPTGAGDAAVASIAANLARGVDDGRALVRDAVAWSAAAVLHPQAGTITDPAPFAARIRVDELP